MTITNIAAGVRTLTGWKRGAPVAASACAVVALLVGAAVVEGAMAKPKHSVKDVMKQGFKGKQSLRTKIVDGTATTKEKAQFLELTQELTGSEPSKGEKADWDKRVAELVKATEAVTKGTSADAVAAFKTASDCKACHSVFKED